MVTSLQSAASLTTFFCSFTFAIIEKKNYFKLNRHYTIVLPAAWSEWIVKHSYLFLNWQITKCCQLTPHSQETEFPNMAESSAADEINAFTTGMLCNILQPSWLLCIKHLYFWMYKNSDVVHLFSCWKNTFPIVEMTFIQMPTLSSQYSLWLATKWGCSSLSLCLLKLSHNMQLFNPTCRTCWVVVLHPM